MNIFQSIFKLQSGHETASEIIKGNKLQSMKAIDCHSCTVKYHDYITRKCLRADVRTDGQTTDVRQTHRYIPRTVLSGDKKVKLSHSFCLRSSGGGGGGVWCHLYLGHSWWKRSPSLSFRCLILPWFEKGTIFCWVDWRSSALITRSSGDFLHHTRVALTTRLQRLSVG